MGSDLGKILKPGCYTAYFFKKLYENTFSILAHWGKTNIRTKPDVHPL